MNQIQKVKIQCKTACNSISGRLPYCWDLNVYRGCGHGCKYCFAIYSHDYLDAWQYKKTEKDTFFNTIYLKENIVEQLERQLTSPNWKGEVINLGGVTDNYQPWEKENGIMTEILKVLIKYKNPCIISTKSDLILRDFDLIDQLSKMTYVNIAATITCIDKELAAKIEPAAALPAHRFNMLKAFQKTDAVTGVHDMPIIPFLTDTDEILESLFEGGWRST